MAEHDAWQRLGLDVGDRTPLHLGEASHLRLRKADVVERVVTDKRKTCLDLDRAEPEVLTVVVVEAPR